jgi:hypothetical protein
MFNNPQNYVKYVKIERQISKLQKEFESISTNNPNKFLNSLSSFDIPQHTYFKFIIECIFYLCHIFAIYYMRGSQLILIKSKLFSKDNILINYYNNEIDSEFLKIPIHVIIIIEGLFLHKICEIFGKILSKLKLGR